jgi:hypothetical protein
MSNANRGRIRRTEDLTAMTRKFWIAIIKDEEFETQFRLSMLPFRYRKAPATKRKLAFVSQRRFASERDAIREARTVFGHILIWKKMELVRLRPRSIWTPLNFLTE